MKFRDIVLAVVIAAVWGVNFIAVKAAVDAFSPFLANTLRFSFVFLALSPFLKWVPGRMKSMLAVAVILGVAHFGLILFAMQVADGVSAVAIASQLGVPFSTILAIIVLKESVGWRRIVGIALSFSGVIVLGFDPVIFAYWQALGLVTLAAFMYAVSTVMMRTLKDIPAVTTQAWVGFAGALGSLLFSFAFENNQLEMIKAASNDAWLALLYSAIGSSIIGHGGANYLFRKYDVSAVTPYFLVMPLFAVMAGVMALDETVSSKVVLGGVLTIAGVLIVTLRNRKKHSKMADVANAEGMT
ncbi:DMT family transporter [Kordiimonas pumila]|uniref:DMT family transporter n=1 Tax=Kordiimonas pumila TaxID=2161677 RepID=A0ABV7D9B2_9PROT|nr:DMT family transporter [Kordiimonas pumila]